MKVDMKITGIEDTEIESVVFFLRMILLVHNLWSFHMLLPIMENYHQQQRMEQNHSQSFKHNGL